jgi:hypothetical protein
MTGSNKILTVSYGTFSCTLEGFDDPFGTMRGIAEYFRDLAADDRYFGAEPPTPDVEMLQNIAQKEVQRRVEARVGDTGVSLRQVTGATSAPTPVAEPAPAAPQAARPAPAADEAEVVESGPLTFDDDFLMADEPEDVLTVDTSATPEPADRPAESVAEKLRRIRAVVSRSIEPEEPGQPFDPAPVADTAPGADPTPARRQRALTETINSITADLSDDDDVDAGFADTQDTEDEPVDLTAEASSDEADEEDVFADALDLAETEDAISEETLGETEAGFVTPLSHDATDLAAEETFEDQPEDTFADADPVEPPVTQDFASRDDEEGSAPEEFVSSPEEDAAFDAALAAAVARSARMDEDDAEDENETETLDPTDLADPADDQRPISQLAPLTETNGDVGRLLEETDQKLADDEGVRRRRVISQMRAAVAATKADRIFSRIISRETQEAEDQSAYRADLSHAITRRPTMAETAEAEKAARPAPLVLVSSQRVDERKPEPAGPRTGAKPGSFREFADQMGAKDLTDLLEAAAAYSAFVEGQPHFSRPDIMKRVARVDPALEVSREAGLRSFGQLLRQGKIQKLQRGQFTVAESTRFNPAQRIAGE